MELSASESELDLIQSTLRDANPDSILQIGTGSFQHSKCIIETVKDLPSTRLTVLFNETDSQVLEQLKADDLDQWADFIQLPADQVLPDFYFQEHSFDLAIINPSYGTHETRVSLYYISKMLNKGSKLIVNELPVDGLRELCRYVLDTREYEVSATSENARPMPELERLVRKGYQSLPQWVKEKTDTLINPTLLETDAMLGLFGNTIVFTKLSAVAKASEPEEMDADALIEAMM